MKRSIGIGAIFLVLYMVFVIALMPANWLIGQIKLPKNIALAGIEGTIWDMKIAQLNVDDIIINQVNSVLSPLSVFMLDPKINISFGDALLNGPEGKLVLRGLLDDITVEDATISVAASDVSARLNLPIDLVAHERLVVNVSRFVMGKPLCNELDGDFQWRNAAVTALNEKVKLGKLSAQLSCEKGALVANVEPKNNLGLSYKAIIKAAGRFSGSGYLTPGKQFPAQLEPALSFIGTPDSKGRYRLTL